MEEIIASIGPKLRELRQQRNLSLKQLADRSGVSAAAIHKIERSNMVPTITTLMKLATSLNRSVSYFVSEDEQPERAAVCVKSGARPPVFTSKKGLALRSISGPYGRFFVAGAIGEIEPGATSGPHPMEHEGEELVYVLQGSLEFMVGGEAYHVRRGDALHFRTDRPHRWFNQSTTMARCLWIALRQP